MTKYFNNLNNKFDLSSTEKFCSVRQEILDLDTFCGTCMHILEMDIGGDYLESFAPSLAYPGNTSIWLLLRFVNSGQQHNPGTLFNIEY